MELVSPPPPESPDENIAENTPAQQIETETTRTTIKKPTKNDPVTEIIKLLFINNLRKCLSVEDFIIKERFGEVSYLEFNNSKKSEFNKPPEFEL